MNDKETIVGVLDGITEKPSGWTEIQVRVDGWQYPVKMATKLAPLVELARAAGTETMEWTFKKRESDQINPHSGKPFINRYFEGVSPVGTAPARAAYSPDLKDRMIVRQTCLKAAAVIIGPYGARADSEDLALETMKAAQRFETWVYRDIDSVPFAPELSEHDDGIPF